MNHSGNYSCVFSEEQLQINKVMGYGHNYIFINVIGKVYHTSAYICECFWFLSTDEMLNYLLMQFNHSRLKMTFNEREMFDIVCFCFWSICPGIY